MLNIFPDLLAFGLFAPLLLRVAAGLVFVSIGWHNLGRSRAEEATFFESLGWKPGIYFAAGLGAIELTTGLLLIAGLYTQIAALAAAIISLGAFTLKRRAPQGITSSRGFLLLLLVVSLSLLVSGAGLFAFDLPL